MAEGRQSRRTNPVGKLKAEQPRLSARLFALND
jgi:hypothetical protein